MNEEKLRILEAELAVIQLARDIITDSEISWSLAHQIYVRLHEEGNKLIDIAFGKNKLTESKNV